MLWGSGLPPPGASRFSARSSLRAPSRPVPPLNVRTASARMSAREGVQKSSSLVYESPLSTVNARSVGALREASRCKTQLPRGSKYLGRRQPI